MQQDIITSGLIITKIITAANKDIQKAECIPVQPHHVLVINECFFRSGAFSVSLLLPWLVLVELGGRLSGGCGAAASSRANATCFDFLLSH